MVFGLQVTESHVWFETKFLFQLGSHDTTLSNFRKWKLSIKWKYDKQESTTRKNVCSFTQEMKYDWRTNWYFDPVAGRKYTPANCAKLRQIKHQRMNESLDFNVVCGVF